MKENYYSKFKEQLRQSMPPVNQPIPQQETPPLTVKGEEPVIEQPISEGQPEIKDNGHKEIEALDSTIPGENLKEHAKEIEDTRRDMMESEKNKNIPGNGYLFNREPKHKLETSIINMLQLHNYVVAKIQTTVLKPDWDSANNMVADMYVENMLEGSIAVEGEARKQFVALTQFKNDERAQAAHGSLFGTGPNG